MKMRSCYLLCICKGAEESESKTSTKRKVDMRRKYTSNNRSEKKTSIQPILSTKKSRSESKTFIKQKNRTKISRSQIKISIKHKNDGKKSRSEKMVEE